IPNSTHRTRPGQPFPLALFDAQRTDLALQRLTHYTGTDPVHFQGFVLLTNYQRYVDDFVVYARDQITNHDEYTALVGPGDVIESNARLGHAPYSGEPPEHLPPMPAYHLTREDGLG